MSKRQKVHNLVEYCYRHGRLPDLLVALEQERASLYHNYFLAWVGGDELLEDVKYADHDFDPSFESVFEQIQRRMIMIFLALLLIVTLFALFVLPELVAQ